MKRNCKRLSLVSCFSLSHKIGLFTQYSSYNYKKTSDKIKDKEYTEQQAREDLALAHRIVYHNKWEEGVCNHLTYALDAEHFLLVPFGLHFSEVQASDFITVTNTGKIINKGSGRGTGELNQTGFWLHSRIHMRLGMAGRALMHTHAPYTTALTMVQRGKVEMVHQNSLRFQKSICYDYNYQGLVLDGKEGDRIGAVMKPDGSELKKILMMGNHGVMIADTTIMKAFNSHYYLERACKHQVLAMSTGLPLLIIDKKVCDHSATYFPGEYEEYYADHHWAATKRLVEQHHPDYKN